MKNSNEAMLNLANKIVGKEIPPASTRVTKKEKTMADMIDMSLKIEVKTPKIFNFW
jgi:hypothetical protein